MTEAAASVASMVATPLQNCVNEHHILITKRFVIGFRIKTSIIWTYVQQFVRRMYIHHLQNCKPIRILCVTNQILLYCVICDYCVNNQWTSWNIKFIIYIYHMIVTNFFSIHFNLSLQGMDQAFRPIPYAFRQCCDPQRKMTCCWPGWRIFLVTPSCKFETIFFVTSRIANWVCNTLWNI